MFQHSCATVFIFDSINLRAHIGLDSLFRLRTLWTLSVAGRPRGYEACGGFPWESPRAPTHQCGEQYRLLSIFLRLLFFSAIGFSKAVAFMQKDGQASFSMAHFSAAFNCSRTSHLPERFAGLMAVILLRVMFFTWETDICRPRQWRGSFPGQYPLQC